MKFLDYIKGQRKGKEAHKLERDSMQDPFLYEAIEGFDSIDDNHVQRINKIQNRLSSNSESVKKDYSRVWQSVAAVAVIIFCIGGYFMVNTNESNLYAQEAVESRIIDVYIPEVYYVENIVPIAQQNAKVAKEVYRPEIAKFKVNGNISPELSKEELDTFSESKDETIIEIYVPDDLN